MCVCVCARCFCLSVCVLLNWVNYRFCRRVVCACVCACVHGWMLHRRIFVIITPHERHSTHLQFGREASIPARSPHLGGHGSGNGSDEGSVPARPLASRHGEYGSKHHFPFRPACLVDLSRCRARGPAGIIGRIKQGLWRWTCCGWLLLCCVVLCCVCVFFKCVMSRKCACVYDVRMRSNGEHVELCSKLLTRSIWNALRHKPCTLVLAASGMRQRWPWHTGSGLL